MLDWKPYDRHNWKNSRQKKFTSPEKNKFERLAARILDLPTTVTRQVWGVVHPPGRNATVIQVRAGLPHLYRRADDSVGLKIYNLKDGKTMWPSVFRFHLEQRANLPGVRNPHVQQVVGANTIDDGARLRRGYVVQHWVEGTVLEEKIKRDLTVLDAIQIADDLFSKIVIPLWNVGTCWWDVRDSNYVFTDMSRLVMIDTDSLGAYANEILRTPHIFTKRNHGSRTALKRYAGLLARMAGRLAPRGEISKRKQQTRILFKQHLAPVFCAPYPLAHGWEKSARQAWKKFLIGYAETLDPTFPEAPPK